MNRARRDDPDRDGWTDVQRLMTLERLLALGDLPLPVLVNQALQVFKGALDLEYAVAYRFGNERNALVAIGMATDSAGNERPTDMDHLRIADGGRIVAVFETGVPFLTGHADEDRDVRAILREDLGIRSLAVVSFTASGKRGGVLGVGSISADRFTQQDLSFLEIVARWVGLVIQLAEFSDGDTSRLYAAEQLITTLAHDLCNFLAPIVLRLDMIHRRADEENRPTDLRDAAVARAAVARLERIIANLLRVERLDQGLFALNPHPFDLAALVRQTAMLLSTEANPITVDAPQTLVVSADTEAISEALENLLANAVKYSPAGAAIELLVHAESRDDREWVDISVRDYGPGIPPDLRSRLFQRFVVGRGSSGLGLGLYLVSQIATQHGGTLRLDTRTTPGTRFILSIPATANQGEASVMERVRVIAVINDDPYFLDAMRDFLTPEGYEVMLHRSGSAAYRAA